MLLGENGGRSQQRHLFARRHRFENGANRDLSFAEAHITAYQPIHRAIALHILLHILHGFQLVGCGLVRKRVFHFLLPGHIFREREADLLGAMSVKLKQIHRHFFDGFADFCSGALPGFARHFIQFWSAIACCPKA